MLSSKYTLAQALKSILLSWVMALTALATLLDLTAAFLLPIIETIVALAGADSICYKLCKIASLYMAN